MQIETTIAIIRVTYRGSEEPVNLRAKGLGIMKITISGKNIDVTEGLKAAVNEKLGKLEKYFTPDTNVIVTLSVEKERQKIEVTIPVKGNIIRSEQVSSDMYVSIDLVEEIIERQLRKYKNKIIDKKQSAGFQPEFVEKDYEEDTNEIKIIRTKKLVSNQCIRKMHVYRWNCWDIISSCS